MLKSAINSKKSPQFFSLNHFSLYSFLKLIISTFIS